MQEIKTICKMCSMGCGIIAGKENGVIKYIKGDREDPRSEGLLCVKGNEALSFLHAKDRILQPLMRVGERGESKWKTITWEEALDYISDHLNKIKNKLGAESISLYRGQASDWGAPWHYAQRFMNLLGSPNMCTPSNLCLLASVIGKRVTYGGVLQPDWNDKTKSIIIWGANPSETNEHGVGGKKIIDSIENGAKLIVIDPFETLIAKKADLWLQIKPGTDCALALAFINVIINENLYDESFIKKWTVGFDQLKSHILDYSPEDVSPIVGIPAEKIKKAARMFACNKPGVIYDRNGLDQYYNAVQTNRAISILLSILGQIDVSGGMAFLTSVKSQFINFREKLSRSVKPVGDCPLHFELDRTVSLTATVDAILSDKPYPIKALLVQGGNPVVTVANTNRLIDALKKLDLLVVMDIFMTRTANFADIVLPASTFLETSGLTTYPSLRTNYLRLQQKVVEPLGDSWPDWKFWFELGKKMGFTEEFSWDSVEDAINEQIQPSGFNVDTLWNKPVFFPVTEKKYEKSGFDTPSGKIELFSSLMEKYGYDPIPKYVDSPVLTDTQGVPDNEYPLIGTGWPRTKTYTQSFLRNIPKLREIEPDPIVMMNPVDAKERNINNHQLVQISSKVGSVKLEVCIDEKVMQGYVAFTWGWGEAVPEANVNKLVDDSIRDPICGATTNRQFLCEVQPII